VKRKTVLVKATFPKQQKETTRETNEGSITKRCSPSSIIDIETTKRNYKTHLLRKRVFNEKEMMLWFETTKRNYKSISAMAIIVNILFL